MAFRAEVFRKFGVVDERLGHRGTQLLGGEDTDFFDRLRAQNVPIGYVPAAVLRHAVEPGERLSVRYLWRRRYWEGYGMGVGGQFDQFRSLLGIPLYYPWAALNSLKTAAMAAAHVIGSLMNRAATIHGIWSRASRAGRMS